jgi:hypothetical protein
MYLMEFFLVLSKNIFFYFLQETATLREQVNKLKRSNQKLEEKMSGLDGKHRFDPSKAFQHKENTAPSSSPLRDG